MPWAGMVRSTDANAGEVVAIPKYWYRVAKEDNILSIEIADGEKEGFSVSPAHMDRGDGKGERDVIYVGRYHCGETAYKSVTGDLPKVSQTRAEFREAIHALGGNVWQFDFATYWTIAMLYLVEFANWDTQSMIGAGCGDGKAAVASGYTDAMSYHTGTNLADRATYGNGVQYRWIEGLWDNVVDWIDGYYQNSLSASVIMNPAEFSDTTGGVYVGLVPGTPGWIIDWTIPSASGYSWALLPSGLDNDSESEVGTCDYSVFDSGKGAVLVFGGLFNGRYPDCGLFSLDGDARVSSSYGDVGARLLVLP